MIKRILLLIVALSLFACDNNNSETLKIEPNGGWSIQKDFFGANEQGNAVVVDDGGNIYTSGAVTNENGGNIFLAKHNKFGAQIFAQVTSVTNGQNGGSKPSVINDMVIDAFGDIYAVGSILNDNNGADSLLIKYNQQGNQLGLIKIPDSEAVSVTSNKQGYIYIVGNADMLGDIDIFLAKYDPVSAEGNQQWDQKWIKYYGSKNVDKAAYIVLNHKDDICVAGYTNGVFSAAESANNGGFDLLLLAMSNSGDILWSRQTGGVQDDKPGGITIDDSGNIYLTDNAGAITVFDPNGNMQEQFKQTDFLQVKSIKNYSGKLHLVGNSRPGQKIQLKSNDKTTKWNALGIGNKISVDELNQKLYIIGTIQRSNQTDAILIQYPL